MNRQRSTARLAVLVALLTLGAAGISRGQVLQQVPSDAPVVIKITNLKAVSDKVGKFATALGLAEMSPELADPLGSMQQEMKLKEGLDTAGEMALVFTKDLMEAPSPEEAIMVLLPVTDYKAFLGNLEGAKTDGPVTTFHPGGGEKELHAVNWGKYAVVAQNKTLLSQRPTGLKLSPLAAKEAKEKDAFIFLNMPVLAEKALPQLDAARNAAIEMIDSEMGDDEDAKQFVGVAKAAVGQAINIAEGFLRDSTATSVSLHLSDQGITATTLAEFKPESYAGKMVKQFKNSNAPLLGGLPAGRKYFAVLGMVSEPAAASQLVSDALDPISKELAATEAGKGFASMLDALKQFAGATKSVTTGYIMPTGDPGTESVMQTVAVIKGDAKIMSEAQVKALNATGDLMKMFPKDAGADMKVEVTPGGKTVGNVKLDSYTFNMAMDQNNPEAANVQQFMQVIYGPDGMSGAYGPVNKDTFVLVQGVSDKVLPEVVKAAQAPPQDTISADAKVKMVRSHLPAQQVGVEYIFVDNIIATVVRYSEGMGFPINFKIPPDQAPIGMSATTEGNALRFDGFVATELIQNLVAGGMQMRMEAEGGAEGGNKEGL